MHDPQDTPAPQRRTASMWRRYVRFWGPRAADDVDDELSYHIEMRVRDYVARGMSEVQAREATTRRLGDLVAARSTCVAITSRRERRMTRAQLIDALVQDVRFALRTLGRQKAWTAVGILTLALGIGANAAVFSVVNNLLLHPLPYPHADRLVIVNSQPTKGNTTGMNVTILVQPTVLKAWRESAHSFEVMEGFTGSDVLLQPATGTPTLLRATSVLPSFPRFAGARPLTGRFFTDEDIASGAKVVVLGEQLWRSRYAGDSAMLGKSMMLDGEIRQVIGVMPASFRIPALLQDATDLWLPLDLKAKTMGVSIVGRLRPGVTHASAGHELDSIAARAGGRNDDVFEFRRGSWCTSRTRSSCSAESPASCSSSRARTSRIFCSPAARRASASWRSARRWARGADDWYASSSPRAWCFQWLGAWAELPWRGSDSSSYSRRARRR
jgi:hypothetical protein